MFEHPKGKAPRKRNKRQQPSYGENIIGPCMLLIGYCFVTYHVLHPFFFPTPTLSSKTPGEAAFREVLSFSIFNACITALFGWVTYLACKHMVSKQLKKAGLSSFILTLNGSWYFFFLGGVLPTMMGLYITNMAISSGLAREYPLFLLNMLGPLASIGSLVVGFPPPGVLKKVFDVIAPDDPDEPPEPPEDDEEDQDG